MPGIGLHFAGSRQSLAINRHGWHRYQAPEELGLQRGPGQWEGMRWLLSPLPSQAHRAVSEKPGSHFFISKRVSNEDHVSCRPRAIPSKLSHLSQGHRGWIRMGVGAARPWPWQCIASVANMQTGRRKM